MGLTIDSSDGFGECCFCGTPTECGRGVAIQFETRAVSVSFFGKSRKERQLSRGQAICVICQRYWGSLESRIGRSIDAGEFAIWAISQFGKKTKTGRHFSEGWRGQKQFDVYGELFGDLAKILIDEAGLSCRITCPSCGT